MTNSPPPRIGVIDTPAARAENTPGERAAGTLRVVTAASGDAPGVVRVVTEAFLHDPIWHWAFPDPAAREKWWRFLIPSAFRYPGVFRTTGFETVSVWIPPNGIELTAGEEAQVQDLLPELVGSRAPEVTELLRRFAGAHPHREPHYYLSLLATADRHRGGGLGMALLRENLARIDLESASAYLESTNPRNDARYASLGFAPIVSYEAPGGGPVVTGMWRQAR
jgi:GNAT superfamily N-acetyltransferase